MSFKKKNERRIDLLRKDFHEGLTVEEQEELIKITKECTELINKKYPLDLSKLEELEKELKKKYNWLKRLIKRVKIYE